MTATSGPHRFLDDAVGDHEVLVGAEVSWRCSTTRARDFTLRSAVSAKLTKELRFLIALLLQTLGHSLLVSDLLDDSKYDRARDERSETNGDRRDRAGSAPKDMHQNEPADEN